MPEYAEVSLISGSLSAIRIFSEGVFRGASGGKRPSLKPFYYTPPFPPKGNKNETKNIISGEGGMLVVNDEKFIERAEIIREAFHLHVNHGLLEARPA